MNALPSKKMICTICGKSKTGSAMIPAALIRDDVAELINASYPRWKQNGYVCRIDLKQFRIKRVRQLFELKKDRCHQ